LLKKTKQFYIILPVVAKILLFSVSYAISVFKTILLFLGIEDPPTQRGIIPRAFQHIFESIQVAENTKFLVHASYLEIYNEEIRDLLVNMTCS